MKAWPILLAALFICLLLWGCGPPYEEDLDKVFGNIPPRLKSYTVADRSIHYAESGRQTGTRVVFLHGTPGSWTAFAAYLADQELAEKSEMIAVDRPGFGQSDSGRELTALSEQAVLLRPLLDVPADRCGVILVGHSLGGPLAVEMAMEYPEKVAALLLIAPSLDPDLESPRWYNRLADYRVVQWLLPTEFVLANREIMVLRDELKSMVPDWASLDLPIIVIQGMKDALVDPANADYVERMVHGGVRIVRVNDAGHFILWRQPDLIKAELMALIDEQSDRDKDCLIIGSAAEKNIAGVFLW